MKVARLAPLAHALALSLVASLAAHSIASAQATSDTPSGYGRTQTVSAPLLPDLSSSLTPSQRLAYLMAQGIEAGGTRFRGWMSNSRQYAAPQFRSAGRSGERGSLQRSTSRKSARPVGR